MKKLVAFLGTSLLAAGAFATHYSWDDFTSTRITYNTGGYYSMAQAEVAADQSIANLEAGVLPTSTISAWANFCKDIETTESRMAIKDYVQSRRDLLGSNRTRNDVVVYSAGMNTTMANGRAVYYTTITAKIPCVRMTADRRHERRGRR